MGTVASGKEGERDASESSGYSDLMEIASALGIEDDDAVHDDAEEIDDLEPVGAGYGGAAAAALVTDASAETPAANVPEPRREPPPPPPPRPSSSTIAAVAPASEPSAPIVAVPDPAAPPAARKDPDAGAAAALLRPTAAPVIPASESRTAAVSLTAAPAAASMAAGARPVAVTPPPREEEKKGGAMIWIAIAGVIALGAGGWYMYQSNQDAKAKVAAADVRPAGPSADEQAEADRLAAEAAAAAAQKSEADRLAAEAAAKTEADRLAAEAAAKAEADRLEQERLAAEAAAAAAAAEAANVEVSVTQKKKDKTKPEPAAVADEPPAEPKEPPVKPEPLTPGEIDEKFRAECVLNPNKAGCEEMRKKSRNTTDLDATLSDKLTQSQIRQGFSSVKGKAKACGGEAGVTVHVKVSIAGDSGNVISADALDDHAGTALGKCVVDALKGASFPRFTSESQGTVYPVRF
jgi:hypothetical protein